LRQSFSRSKWEGKGNGTKLVRERAATLYIPVIDASPEVKSRPFFRRRVHLSITFRRERKTAFISFPPLPLYCSSPHAQLDRCEVSTDRTIGSESKNEKEQSRTQQKVKSSQWRDRTADIGLTPFQVLGPHHNQLDKPGGACECNFFCINVKPTHFALLFAPSSSLQQRLSSRFLPHSSKAR
jgi:hypothetical protein